MTGAAHWAVREKGERPETNVCTSACIRHASVTEHMETCTV
jgi:hypothetical protein